MDFIYFGLKRDYPYIARVDSGGLLKYHNGLVFLSKFPLKNVKLVRYNQASWLERLMATKSMLTVEVEIPNFGNFLMVNMHTTAGGTHPLLITDAK